MSQGKKRNLNDSRSSLRDSNYKLHSYVEQMVMIDKMEANLP